MKPCKCNKTKNLYVYSDLENGISENTYICNNCLYIHVKKHYPDCPIQQHLEQHYPEQFHPSGQTA